MEALPPNLRDLTLWPELLEREQTCACPRSPGPESALELRPRIALSSAQVKNRVAVLEPPGNTGHFTC